MLFEPVEAEFARFYGEQLSRDDAAILVAELEGGVVGYAFVRVEPESFVDALAAAAWIHDIYVDELARGRRVGALLMDAAVEAARGLGASSVMLSVAAPNEGARRMFERQGFRLTMQEMRMEL
jgi:GNAT superfamily N-acetyltransferase